MTDSATQPVSGEVVSGEMGMIAMDPDTLATIDALAASIPEGGEDAAQRMAEQLLGAASANDLDAPWRSLGLKKLNGVPILITDLKRMVSDYDQGLGFYLIATVAIKSTGEVMSVSTGSAFVVLQLLRAWALEQANPGSVFPWAVIPRVSDKPTANGFYPMHLEVIR